MFDLRFKIINVHHHFYCSHESFHGECCLFFPLSFLLWTHLVTPSQCPKHLVMLVRLSFSMSLTYMEPSCIFCCIFIFLALQKSYSVLCIMPTPKFYLFLLAFPTSLVSFVYFFITFNAQFKKILANVFNIFHCLFGHP